MPDPADLVLENAAAGCRAWDAWSGIALEDDGTVERLVSDIRHPLFNIVLGTRFAVAATAADVAGVIAPYCVRGVPMAWWTAGPHAPADALLREAGMIAGPPTSGMIVALDDALADAAMPAGVAAVAADEGEALTAWCRLTAAVYGLPGFAAEAWRAMQSALPTGRGAPWRRFLAVEGGTPVAAVSLLAGPRAAALADVATLAAHRRRGIAGALCRHALLEARAQGYGVATLAASVDGEGVYARLGFLRACAMPLWIWPN